MMHRDIIRESEWFTGQAEKEAMSQLKVQITTTDNDAWLFVDEITIK